MDRNNCNYSDRDKGYGPWNGTVHAASLHRVICEALRVYTDQPDPILWRNHVKSPGRAPLSLPECLSIAQTFLGQYPVADNPAQLWGYHGMLPRELVAKNGAELQKYAESLPKTGQAIVARVCHP